MYNLLVQQRSSKKLITDYNIKKKETIVKIKRLSIKKMYLSSDLKVNLEFLIIFMNI